MPRFLYQTEIKGKRARKRRDRERECECEHWRNAAIASVVNRPLENTFVEINKIIGICECVID